MLTIQKKISNYNFSSRNGSAIKYIVLHYTGNKGDTALDNATYFYNGNRNASAHYFVDDDSIWQSVEDSNSAWAVGDGKGVYGITNRNSLSIEMCCDKNGNITEKTEANVLELVKYKQKQYGISDSNVVRHYDASRKICPNWSADNWKRWTNFKAKLSGEAVENVVVTTPPNTNIDPVYEKAKLYNKTRCLEIQQKLNKVGYSLAEDNIYGQATHKAIGDFQSKNGLEVDFLFGKASFAKLNELIAKKTSNSGDDWIARLQKECNAQGFSNQKVDGIAGVNTLNGCPTLRQGASGNITKLLQEKLVSLGYNTNGVEGIYGSGTVRAVKEYQASKSLSQDGVCGQNTWRKLLGL